MLGVYSQLFSAPDFSTTWTAVFVEVNAAEHLRNG